MAADSRTPRPTRPRFDLGGGVGLGNDLPLVVIGGMNVLESRDLALSVAERFAEACRALGMPWVFKASWDKANRSALHSYRGPGLDTGLSWLRDVGAAFDVPILTDVHEPGHCAAVAEVASVIQIPAFLSRQTDLLAAACSVDRPLHIKKMQMAAPEDLAWVLDKCAALGEERVVLCERGTAFGYHRLVVDPLSFPVLKALGAPVSFDVTHAVQLPGGLGDAAGGLGAWIEPLGRAGVSQGIAAIFVEAHPDPASAKCDGPSALRLDEVGGALRSWKRVDEAVKAA